MDITSLSRDYLEEATNMRRVYTNKYGVSLDVQSVTRAYDAEQPYWYAGMYWRIMKNPVEGAGGYVLGMHLH